MEKEFVPYKQALALKGIGFDEPCIARFIHKQFAMNVLAKWYKHNSNEITTGWISAPTFSQCFRWFRENYRLSVLIHDCLDDYIGEIVEWTISEDKVIHEVPSRIETYEDAELECLDNLIKIVEQKIVD